MNYKRLIKTVLFTAFIVLSVNTITSCKSGTIPDHIKPIEPFDVNKYNGEWYEIARFDFKHEKDLSNVTANYSLNNDGSIKVVNKGFNYVKNKWEEANGKAKFTSSKNIGSLQVSFFGPFYAGYHIVMLEPNYNSVLIFGDDTDYIWILSRDKTINESTKEKYLAKAKEAGYDLNRLVWTKHDKQ